MGDLDDDRYQSILRLIGDQRRDFQQFETSVLQSQAEHWKSVTIAIRTLSDWWVKHADSEIAERKARQTSLDAKLTAIERLLRVVIIGALLAAGAALGWWLL